MELRTEAGRTSHYLDGHEVRDGDVLELLTSGECWIRGRYEWSGKVSDRPRFFFRVGDAAPEVSIHLPEKAQLRRPRDPSSAS